MPQSILFNKRNEALENFKLISRHVSSPQTTYYEQCWHLSPGHPYFQYQIQLLTRKFLSIVLNWIIRIDYWNENWIDPGIVHRFEWDRRKKVNKNKPLMKRVPLVRIAPLRSLIVLYGHEVSSYRDFTAATRSIVPPRRGYRRGKIVASVVSHRYDTVNSSGEYSLGELSNVASVAFRPRDSSGIPDESPRKPRVDRLSLLFIASSPFGDARPYRWSSQSLSSMSAFLSPLYFPAIGLTSTDRGGRRDGYL